MIEIVRTPVPPKDRGSLFWWFIGQLQTLSVFRLATGQCPPPAIRPSLKLVGSARGERYHASISTALVGSRLRCGSDLLA